MWHHNLVFNESSVKIIRLFCVVTFLMAGCQLPINYSDLSDTPIAEAADTPTISPDSVLMPTPMSSQTSDSGNEYSCPRKVEKETSLVGIATGTIVSQKTLNYQPFFLDLQINQKYEAPAILETVPLEKSVSPDGKLLATIDVTSGSFESRYYLRIFNARAEILEEVTFDIPELHHMHWLDNQNLLLYTALTPRDGRILLFNPFTRKQIYVYNEMPFFLEQSDDLYPGLRWLIEYSPDLEWGVYLAADDSGSINASSLSEPYLGPIVYDFSLHKPIWIPRYRGVDFPLDAPKWSPDGNRVVIETSNQLNIVSRDGKVTTILDESDTNRVFFPLWSPDGNSIAFWNNSSLMYYNIPNGDLYDLCPDTDRTFPFAWSPDSRFILIDTYTGENSTLIDVQEKLIYSITASLEIHYPGWMTSLP